MEPAELLKQRIENLVDQGHLTRREADRFLELDEQMRSMERKAMPAFHQGREYRFILDGLLPAPRGVPQIEVTFDIDANGILNVTAQDKATGKEQKITITAGSGLSKDEVDKLQKEAELYGEEDRRRREEIETRNQADSLAYTAEKTLREQGDKVPAELRGEVEGKIQAVRTALQGSEIEPVRSAAAEVLGTLGRREPAVLDMLLSALSDEQRRGRSAAAEALGAMGRGEPDVLNTLLSALNDEDAWVRGSAAWALGELGQPDPAILSALRATLNEERNREDALVGSRTQPVREFAFEALWELAGKASTDERVR